jgi:transcription antitermination factor NusG
MNTGADTTEDDVKHLQHWHVLWTRSNCEESVYEKLSAKGFDLLLPTVDKWSRRKKSRCMYRAPMFPGYLFIHQSIDKYSYLEISKAQGMVRILGERWDKLAVVPDQDIELISRIQNSDMLRMPYPYLKAGQTVRIVSGPLANVEGIFLKSAPEKGLLILSIELLCRSLAVQVDCTAVVSV